MLMPASSSAWGNAMGTALAPFVPTPGNAMPHNRQRFLPNLTTTIPLTSHYGTAVSPAIRTKSISIASDSYQIVTIASDAYQSLTIASDSTKSSLIASDSYQSLTVASDSYQIVTYRQRFPPIFDCRQRFVPSRHLSPALPTNR